MRMPYIMEGRNGTMMKNKAKTQVTLNLPRSLYERLNEMRWQTKTARTSMSSARSSGRRWRSRAFSGRTGASRYDLHDLGGELVTHLHGRTGQRMELPLTLKRNPGETPQPYGSHDRSHVRGNQATGR